jgi:hypothetical protein
MMIVAIITFHGAGWGTCVPLVAPTITVSVAGLGK